MAQKRQKRKSATAANQARRTKKQYYSNPNHDYFTEHFEELVDHHGGKYLVMADGEVVAICYGHEMDPYVDQIRERGIVPFIAPIPRPEEIECLL
jgi:hypothetical protein